jgi:rod shape-determining protein MreD
MLKDVLFLNVMRFLVLSILQILYFSHINLYGYFNPQVFVLIILLFPIHISTINIMLMAFGIGFIQDVFQGTLGLHVFTCVFIGFIRVFIVRLFTEKKLDETFELSFSEQGFRFYFLYLLFAFLINHFIYYVIEMFSMSNMMYIIFKTLGSTTLALIFSFLFLYLFKGKKVFVKY